MLKDEFKNEIVVKTKEGDFKLLKNGKLIDLPSSELAVSKDEIVVQDTKIKKQISNKLQDLNNKFQGKFQILNSKPSNPVGRPTANFYFSVEDEKEVEKIKKQANDDVNKKIKEYILSVVQHIIDLIVETGAATVDENNKQQLANVITTRLKSIRTLAETKEALQSSMLMHGKPLSQKSAEIVVELIERKRKEIESAIRTGEVPEGKVREIKPFKKNIEAPMKQKAKQPMRSAVVNEIVKPEMNVDYNQAREVVDSGQISRHVTMGPIDELRALDLKEFRKLGGNPGEAAAKVYDKIGLLEDESLVRKAEGIKAWQTSTVYKVYMTMGMLSMAEKKNIETVAKELKAKGEEYLTPEEFLMIADLNQRLSY